MSYTEQQVTEAANRACDDILDAVEADDEGVRDALNLMVNATLEYLRDPQADLTAVIARSYPIGEGEDGPLDWIRRAH